MGKKVTQFLLSAGLTAAFFIILSVPLGTVPPVGSFLSPTTGFWANAVTGQPADQTIELPEDALSDSVSVYVDRYRIPHIFAQNDRDLYFAQGYITARDRLWQMELQTRAAAGRLSEILGQRTLEYDRYQRRIGMGYAAEKSLKAMLEVPQTATAVKSYARGVNAWINRLGPADLPLEYKLLNYRPEEWTPLKTALLLKNLTYTLAGRNQDLQMSNTRAFFGEDFIGQVLDVDPELNDPIIPTSKQWTFEPRSVQQPDSFFTPAITDTISPFQPNPLNGSNNWAVSGSKTSTGYPILANDPHLGMTLPSIWYAMQLHSPDQNTMGVSLPGAPAIIIGFNEDAAWGTTNVGADVWDWYEIQFRDSTLEQYRYDGQWKSTTKRIEKIEVKGAPAVIDTVSYTHHGPITQSSGGEPMRPSIPKYHAMRWIAYKKSNELQYFLEINKASGYQDYRRALRYFDSPAQNWVFADSNDIALTVTGKYPLKWNEQGRFIGDGSDPQYDWQGWIPFEQIPFVKNPERGFVSSANQDPTDDSYPYYLDDEFGPYERGRRINDRLEALNNITSKDMQQLQMDTYSYHAQTLLPVFLQHLNRDTLLEVGGQALKKLTDWNLEKNAELVAPSIFNYWSDAFYTVLWGDEYGQAGFPLQWPARDQTVQLVKQDTTLRWIDDVTTTGRETLSDLINRSFKTALEKLEAEFGTFGDRWKWGYVNNTDINHVAQIPGLGRKNVFTGGGDETVNAIRGSHGPSWRMVVELGPEIKAQAIYPGGQSGNPGSPYYDNMIDDWVNGKLYPLWFMKQQPNKKDSLTNSLILQ